MEIDTILFNDKPKKESESDFIENNSFIPHFLTGDVDVSIWVEFIIILYSDCQ